MTLVNGCTVRIDWYECVVVKQYGRALLDEIDAYDKTPARSRANDYTIESSQRTSRNLDRRSHGQTFFRRDRNTGGQQLFDLSQVMPDARLIVDRDAVRDAIGCERSNPAACVGVQKHIARKSGKCDVITRPRIRVRRATVGK